MSEHRTFLAAVSLHVYANTTNDTVSCKGVEHKYFLAPVLDLNG